MRYRQGRAKRMRPLPAPLFYGGKKLVTRAQKYRVGVRNFRSYMSSRPLDLAMRICDRRVSSTIMGGARVEASPISTRR